MAAKIQISSIENYSNSYCNILKKNLEYFKSNTDNIKKKESDYFVTKSLEFYLCTIYILFLSKIMGFCDFYLFIFLFRAAVLFQFQCRDIFDGCWALINTWHA